MIFQLISVSLLSFGKFETDPEKEEVSPYLLFCFIYLETFSSLEKFENKRFYEKLNNQNYFLSGKHEVFFKFAQDDKANFNDLKKFHASSLATIDPGLKEVIDLFKLLKSEKMDRRKELLIKYKDACMALNIKQKISSKLMGFYWNVFLYAFLISPELDFDEEFKINLIKNYLLPYLEKPEPAGEDLSEYTNELLAECKFQQELFEGNYTGAMVQIKTISGFRNTKYKPGDIGRSRPVELKIQLLMKQKKYEDVIREFKSIPAEWLDAKEGLKSGERTLLTTNAAIAYHEIGNKELAKIWQELSYSNYCSATSVAGQEFALKQATLLRNLYLEEKSWTLMRNLEDRCAKFGMKPLPKQAGE